jgi:hypothetical protein
LSGKPSLLGLLDYGCRCLGLAAYLEDPGDGRTFPQIPASDLLRVLIGCRVLRAPAAHAVEQMVRHAARGFGVCRSFGDDAVAYFTERLDAGRLRAALLEVLWRARRNKVFDDFPRIGLALDGTGLGQSKEKHCELCHAYSNAKDEVSGHGHKTVGASLVAGALSLPLDVEYYRPGESELTASKRLLKRVVGEARIRFDFVVVDGLYPGAPFLHLCDQLRVPVVARLTVKLPDLFERARKRFAGRPPTVVYDVDGERVEIWDAEDFLPWEGLNRPWVRVIRYRQYRRKGDVIEAYWLTNFSRRQVGSLALYKICKSRWQIENRFFNEGKNLYGLAHVAHHDARSVVIDTLLTCLAICLERLYRLRHLHRGTHEAYAAQELCWLFWIALGAPPAFDTS